jgi:phage shock protein A
MNLFKRWTSGIVGRIDGIVARVENHDALVQSTIREQQDTLARAHVQLSRVHKDGAALKERLQTQLQAEVQWKERAKACLQDEERALECLRRGKSAGRSAKILQERITEHRAVETRLENDIRALQEGLQDLKEQRNVMRARQTRAEAMDAVRDNRGQMAGEIQDVLERWEIRIKQTEFNGNCLVEPADQLEEGFGKEEERQALRQELEELRRNHG